MTVVFLPPSAGGAASVPDATDTTAGKIRIATQAESNAGTNDTTAMTPLRVQERITSALAGGVEYKGAYTGQSLVTALKGDMYVSQGSQTLAGVSLSNNDHIIFNQDAANPVTSSMFDVIDNTESDTLDTVTGRGATTSNAVQVGGLNIAGAYALPTSDGSVNQVLQTDGAGAVSFASLGTMSTQAANSVSITGGSVTGITDIAIADGGTGASTASGARTNLGVAIGSDVQGYDAQLADVAGLTPSNNHVIVGDGNNFTAAQLDLNKLSDVSYTAGAGIDNYVLTYDHASTSWGAEAAASGGLSEIVQDTTPQLGGPLDTNGNAITSAGGANVTINPNGAGVISIGADIVPDADATHDIGTESARYAQIHGELDGAVMFKARNETGGALTKGQAVYISGVSGSTPLIALARANSASTMQAFGLLAADVSNNADVQVITFGNLVDIDTSSFSAGDTVFISSAAAGALVNTAPTGTANLIQNIGKIVRSHASAGIIKVGGAGRTNATPNLDQDQAFIGNASNQAVATNLSAINLSKFNNDLSVISAVVDDTSPELGGDLDVLTRSIVSSSNRAITLAPNGSGLVTIAGNATSGAGQIQLNCEQNSHGIKIKGPAHSAAASYTLTLPNDTGSNGQFLKTDGNGALSWDAASGGGGSVPNVTSASPSGAYTISTHAGIEEVYLLTPSADIVVNIPAASAAGAGFKYQIKNLSGSYSLTLTPASSNIDGSSTYVTSSQNESLTLLSDGSNYYII